MSDLIHSIGLFLASAPLPILVLAKATIIFLVGWTIAVALRNSSSAARHAVWALTLAAAVAIPVGTFIAPAWRIAVARRASFSAPATQSASNIVPSIEKTSPLTAITAAQPSTRRAKSVQISSSLPDAWPVFVWITGVLFVLGRMILGRILLNGIAKRGRALDDPSWSAALEKESLATGVSRNVRLVSSAQVSTPLTAGARSPMILLPAECDTWDASHREVILRHELAHIANGDATICSVAGIACAIYWFHPLAWLAARKLRIEQERACDDRVLSLGTSATEYASHLLDVARSARALGMQSFVAVAMARPTELEGRLLAVLNEARNRASLTRRTKLFLTAIAALSALLLAALTPIVAEARVVIASQGPLTTASTTITRNSNTTTNTNTLADKAVPRVVVKDRPVADSIATGEVVVRPGGTLTLDLRTGAGLTIIGSNENVVRMRATLSGRDWRITTIGLTGDGTNARIETRYRPQTRGTSSSHHIDITVPRRFNIRLSSAGGELELRDVEGDFSGQTGGGEINIENARGSAELSTGGGDITVEHSDLRGSVSTGGGTVTIQDVTGGLDGASGSGQVYQGRGGFTFSRTSRKDVRRGSDGKIYSHRSGGSVDVGDAPNGASIHTGGGAIRIGRAGGEVDATTGGGDVTIGPLSGSAEVSTGAGDVRIDVIGGGDHDIRVESGSGTVTLVLPRNISADLDLETAYTNNRSRKTRIESDWPLSTTETGYWDSSRGTPRKYVRARETLGGGGARIRVRTVNGNIVIRRGG